MIFRYELIQAGFVDELGNKHLTYGIKAIDKNGKTIEAIENIYTDVKQAEKLIELCNEEKVELVHFRDVIEDSISE